MRKLELVIAISLGTLLTTAVMADNLVVNGGFEEPSLASGSYKLFSSIPGWTRAFGNAIEVQDNAAGSPYEGDNLVELDGYENTGIYQNISTVPGQTYTLKFALSPRQKTSAADNKLKVLWNGTELTTIEAGAGGSSTSWTVHSYSVVASGDTTRLEFQDKGTSNGLGTYIDDVSLEEITSPSCQLYGVHDDGLNDSQLFTVDPETLEVNALGELHEKHDIEALDIHPQTAELFAASGDNTPKKGYLYQVNKTTGEVTAIGATGCREVDALSFHPNGTLWGWAQDCGLLTINTDTGKANVEIPVNQVEVEDITWNTIGTILYGVENLHGGHHPDSHGEDEDNYHKDLDFDQGVKLWTYDYSTGTIKTACDDLTQSQIEIEALETLPDDSLLFGFHGIDGILNVGAVDVQNCQLIAQEELPTVPYNDVEGIAWQACGQCSAEEAELVAKFEWTEDGYVFEKPEGNDTLVTITGNAVSGTWRSEIPMSHIILKGGTNTGTINVPDQNTGDFSNTVIPVNGGGNIPEISNIQFFGCPDEDEDSENNREALKPGHPGGFAVGGINNA